MFNWIAGQKSAGRASFASRACLAVMNSASAYARSGAASHAGPTARPGRRQTSPLRRGRSTRFGRDPLGRADTARPRTARFRGETPIPPRRAGPARDPGPLQTGHAQERNGVPHLIAGADAEQLGPTWIGHPICAMRRKGADRHRHGAVNRGRNKPTVRPHGPVSLTPADGPQRGEAPTKPSPIESTRTRFALGGNFVPLAEILAPG